MKKVNRKIRIGIPVRAKLEELEKEMSRAIEPLLDELRVVLRSAYLDGRASGLEAAERLFRSEK